MKKFKILIIIFFLELIIISFFVKAKAITKLDGIENFPISYQGYLKELEKKHPNWNFTALYTNLDWNYVINEENIFGRNLVPKNYTDDWKNTNPGEYNLEVDLGWVDSSKKAIEYCMDPRNFLNEVRIFQFEGLSYNSRTNNLNGIEKILYGTEFYNQQVSYVDGYGNTINMNEKYSNLILNAGQASRVSPYHLASRIKQEVGPFLSHNSISGRVSGYEGLYNFYNIGATSSAEPMGAIKNGLQYAKDGKNASDEIKSNYLIPWNTKEKAITGGAIFIGSSYINKGQNTIYLQKFHVNPDSKDGLFWHQYMTNVLAPYSESKSIYNGYKKSNLLDTPMSFIIPIYDNMPNIPTQNPNINLKEFSTDNTKVYCNATDVNIRIGPSTSYEIITTISNPQNMIRIRKGNQSGEKWDMVLLPNGIIGYIYQQYVSELATEIEIEFTNPLRESGSQITGMENNTVLEVKSKIITNNEIEIVNNKNKILQDNDLIGTGSKVRIKENGIVIKEYNFILYGDIDGDGKITSIDLLVLQRQILEIEKVEEIYRKAGNINKNGQKPTSIDLLLIQRHILNLKIIQQ